MVYITRKTKFSAAHRLHNPTLDETTNQNIYDKCNNQWGHGHNYFLEVTICGIPNPETGYLIDLKLLKKIIDENIISKVDHKNLNHDVDFLNGIITTLENMAALFWQQIESKLPAGKLYRIKLWETENNSVEYFGDKFLINNY